MRHGGAFGRGITTKGESVAVSVEEAREIERRERIRIMAESNRKAKENDAFSATPGARAGTKVEQPMKVGPPDALLEGERTDSDYVPDMESKGYHVGVVRQPVEQVQGGFTSDRESKFAAQPTIDDLKAAHNERESSKEWQEGVQAATPTLNDRERKANGIDDAKAK